MVKLESSEKDGIAKFPLIPYIFYNLLKKVTFESQVTQREHTHQRTLFLRYLRLA